MTETTMQDGVRTVYKAPMTIVVLPDGSKGFAKCSPDDEYDKDIGKNLAYERAVRRAEKLAARMKVKLHDQVTINRNTENARVKGLTARVIQFVNDDTIIVELERKVPMVFSSPGALFRLIYSNHMKLATSDVTKIIRRK